MATAASHSHSRWRIAKLALASRIVLLLAMSLSCALLPDFYPGEEVLQFEMRLTGASSSSTNKARGQTCYCLQGHACDDEWKSRRRIKDIASCAHVVGVRRYMWLDKLYTFILPPVTKWDAARFLTISVDPWTRYPSHIRSKDDYINKIEDQTCNSKDATTASCKVDDDAPSEQAHAFFPLLPLAIRYMTKILINCIPLSILPSTYEATSALSAVIINMIAFVIASISLYDMTIFILKREALEMDSKFKSSPQHTQIDKELQHVALATTAAQLFCLNPAGVFFTAAYSESIFAMFTFAGHAIAARGQYCQCYLQKRRSGEMLTRELQTRSHIVTCLYWANIFWLPSTILWILASLTRSNGTFSAIWWIIIGTAKCCSYIRTNRSKGVATAVETVASLLLLHLILAILVALPVLYHDLQGYNYHCIGTNEAPSWCKHQIDAFRRFSLYAHVQHKYWNVGLFRYYEVKQIPNFILAAPILVLSFAAAVSWIRSSWSRHMKRWDTVRLAVVKDSFLWAYLALSSSIDYISKKEIYISKKNNTPMLLGSKFLPHYAILTGFALVGAFLAHVQISTRLICSSCPAFYWFVASLIVKDQVDVNAEDKSKSSLTKLLYFYFGLYNLLGVIMHVNWLPWT